MPDLDARPAQTLGPTPPPLPLDLDPRYAKVHHSQRHRKLHHSVSRRAVRTPRPRSRGVVAVQKRCYKFTCTFCWETYRVGEGMSPVPAAAASSLALCGGGDGGASVSSPAASCRGPPPSARASSVSSPRIVGTSARIACEACWVQLHNLSICWACGDSVVRGEECVSFGWTFWHRGCFGCLSCRAPLTAPGDVGEFAVEVFETPVCEKCRVEDEVAASGGRVVGSDGCEDLRAGRTVRGVRAVEAVSGFKGGRKSMLRKQRRGTGKKGMDTQICPIDKTTTNPPASFLITTTSSPSPSPFSHSPASTGPHSPPTPYVSIFDPLNTPAFKPTSRSKKPPNWLARLPSGLETTAPRPLSKLSREILVGSPEPMGRGAGITVVKKRRRSGEVYRRSGPVVSFAQDPRSEIPTSPTRQSDARKKIRSRKATPIPASATNRNTSHKTSSANSSHRPREPVASMPYPFFQNPRRPIIPAVESTWSNNKLSPGLFPYAEEHSSAPPASRATKRGAATTATAATPTAQKGVISSFRSTEYLDRYRDTAKAYQGAPSVVLVCPCCSEPIGAGAATVVAGNGHVYHEGCFRCRGCKGVVDVKGGEWVVLGVSPWHRGCVRPPRQQQQQQKQPQQQQQVRKRGASSVTGTAPRMGKGGTPGGLGLGLGMGGFFSAVRGSGSGGGGSTNKKLIQNSNLSPSSSHLVATFDDSCAGCGGSFPPPASAASSSSPSSASSFSSPAQDDQPVPGPRDTTFHRKCLRCRRCEARLKAGNRWYEWDGRGLMGVLCR